MKLFKAVKKAWKNEGFTKIRRYIWGPAWVFFVGADILTLLAIVGLLAFGKLENMIVSMNIRYNSPVFKTLIIVFLVVLVCSVSYGTILSLRTYKRTSKRGILKPSYREGSSYKALAQWLDGKMYN